MCERLKSARNNERFRNEGCCARAVSDTRKRGRKRGQQPPFPLLRSLFLGQGWVTHVPSASTPFVGTQTPTLQILIRSPEERTRRNACCTEGGFLPDVFAQASRFRSSVNRISPETQRVSSRDAISFWGFFFEFKGRFKFKSSKVA